MMQVREGALDRLGVLFERHSGILYSFYMKRTNDHNLSEDLTQEVFLRVLKYRQSFKPGSAFRAWMFSIARNTQYRQWERRFSKNHVLSDSFGIEGHNDPEDGSIRPDMETNKKQETALLYEALEKLPEKKRQLVVMRRIQNLSYIEMAEILDCEPVPLRTLVHRAVKELTKQLQSLMKEASHELS